MAYGTAIKRGLQIAGKIDKKYNLNKIFIDKYLPPGYRKTAYKIVDITGALGGGYGIYQFVNSLIQGDNNLNDGIPQTYNGQQKTYPKNKTRYRSTARTHFKCPPNFYPNKSYRYSRNRFN